MKKYLFLSITSLLLASFMVACEDEDTLLQNQILI